MIRVFLSSLALLASSFNLAAKEQLELGIGAFNAYVPHYIGADQSQNYIVPLPYVRYRSDKLQVNRNNAVGYLWQQNQWHLSLSATGSIAIDSDKNTARKNMPDLGWVAELGPALDYYFIGTPQAENFVKTGLFVRKALATDFKKISDIGGKYGIYGEYQHIVWQQANQQVQLNIKGAINFATQGYLNYYYSVAHSYQTRERSAYQAQSGYAGEELSLGISYDTQQWWAGGFIKYYRLKDTAHLHSPLVKRSHNIAAGIGVAWKFYNKTR